MNNDTELIKSIVKHTTKKNQDSQHKFYYFVNVIHPTIAMLYNDFRVATCGNSYNLPSDAERLAFELELLKPSVVEKLKKYYEKMEGEKNQ